MERQTILRILNVPSRLMSQKDLVHLTGHRMLIPVWHAVNDKPGDHYNRLFSVPGTASFIETLDSLLQNFKAVGLQELRAINASGKKLSRPVMHLTFDDGLRECHEIIAPILLKKGIPATFFINPSFIGNGDLFFRYKASLLANRMRKKQLPECMLAGVTNLLMTNEIPCSSLENGLFHIPWASRNLLDEAAQILQADFKKYLNDNQPYMTQGQVRGLISQGFTIGSHSMDHPAYLEIGREDQLEQTIISLERVVMEYGLDYMAFAFPFSDMGIPRSFWDDLKTRISVPVLTFGTSGLKSDSVPGNLQRTGMELNRLNGREIIKSEYLYCLLKMPFGKNSIKRT
ncbi:MAG: polysaccharide deacetylase family protein [Bacteroidales bacterium]